MASSEQHANQSNGRVLIIDDDRQLAGMLLEYLEKQGFVVDVAGTGEDGLDRIHADRPDLVVLDVMLPGIDGFAVLDKIRLAGNLPVIMLTARGEEGDRILGLMGGADDYLPKPFNPLELSVRIKAVLKRSQSNQPVAQTMQTGPMSLDSAKCLLTVHNSEVKLTAAELHAMELLMRHQGEVLSRARLTEFALNRPLEAYDRSIDTIISRLRGKLEKAGIPKECIKSLRGHGYVLDADSLDSLGDG